MTTILKIFPALPPLAAYVKTLPDPLKPVPSLERWATWTAEILCAFSLLLTVVVAGRKVRRRAHRGLPTSAVALAIVVGRQGGMIKPIGTEAREELEGFFQTKVYLDLRVKVKERCREDERFLDEIGLRRSE